ncbi:hypothetical protein [Geothrix alkalitolerans]|uniref:hypothetical protein n=1 Tax=Geothrix alkalitolerans TaxID=2922724 RepID=UPI001FB01AB9|nr:hypothetical protein [Geothrix alkalitolerans]
MSAETLINLVVGISTGVATGLYSALIVARYQRFADLRAQLLKIIREIDTIHEGPHIIFPRRKEIPEFSSVACDFLFLQHRQAGDMTLRLSSEITTAMYLASNRKMDYESFSKSYSDWQDTCRNLAPSKKQLFQFWSGL